MNTAIDDAETLNTKKRHGCLTAWLLFGLFGALTSIIDNLLFSVGAKHLARFNVPHWAFYAFIALAAIDLVCIVALLRWKKWGFWGLCISNVVTVMVNLASGMGLLYSLLSLTLIPLEYFILQIGKDNKGWPQLN